MANLDGSDQIRTLGESQGSSDGWDAGAQKPCQDLRKILVYMAG